MQYLPYDSTIGLANIIVDGSANQSTVLALSHWKNSGTPDQLKADLSAGIVFNYLDSNYLDSNYLDYLDRAPLTYPTADVASNNHFDEDGLVGLYSLLNPEAALPMREILIDIANAGDFGKYSIRDAARVCFVLQSWQDPELSPLKSELFAQSYDRVAAVLYEELLPRLPSIVQKIDHFHSYWEAQDQLLSRSEADLVNGEIEIEEVDDFDLAIVTAHGAGRADDWPNNIHQFAIHNATDKLRVLLVAEDRYELYYRYETWIELHSRTPAPRADLTHLAAELTEMESGRGRWQFAGCDALTPRLKLVGTRKSKISKANFREKLLAHLSNRVETQDRKP